jgi:hypothetical protein
MAQRRWNNIISEANRALTYVADTRAQAKLIMLLSPETDAQRLAATGRWIESPLLLALPMPADDTGRRIHLPHMITYILLVSFTRK